ncbi:tyrosine-type recombinase/integrase [Jiangella muralis]|uniref:tyrosine-type recombinase/integrase n=1 Tax=Jiangella muralis TaxID=702383 RepID=UPI00196A19AE|nr:tyrosine-type recombinase/integrase [Jiangella muralis]
MFSPTGPWEITDDELIRWVGGERWAAETRRSYYASFRKFYGWAYGTARTTANPALALPSVAPGQPSPRPTPDRVYKETLLAASRRERLMVRLAEEQGLRRGEVAVAHSDDLIEDLTGWSLLVHGKGGKTRVVPLLDTVAAELLMLGPGYFFPGHVDGHLSPRWVGKLLARLMPGKWTMHSLRHRFASKAYAAGDDLFALQDVLGHASPNTTRRYVHVPDDRRRRLVHAAAGVPVRRREPGELAA